MVAPLKAIDEMLRSDLIDDPTRIPAAEPLQSDITARRRRRWANQAALAGVALGAMGGFLVISRAIDGARSTPFDQGFVRAMGRARHPWSNAVMRGVTFLGSVAGASMVSLGAAALARKRPRLVWQVVTGAAGGITAELGWKRIFRRKRPTLLEHLEDVRSTSFPSGHAMAASSLYLSLAFVASRSPRLCAHRALLLAGASGIALSVGATRVYLGVHWPTDVLGGLALGTAWACAAEALFDLSGAERVERAVAETASSGPARGAAAVPP